MTNRISMYARLRGVSPLYQQSFRGTHFFPMQPRGPMENGRLASLWSLAYAGSNHRSGMKSSGFRKLSGLCAAHHVLTETVV